MMTISTLCMIIFMILYILEVHTSHKYKKMIIDLLEDTNNEQ